MVATSIGRPVKVDVLPTAIKVMPDSSFLGGPCLRLPIDTEKLRQSGISDNGDIPHQSDVRRANRALTWTFIFQIKVKAMKLQTFDQMPAGFRFESGEVCVAQIDVRAPVAPIDGCQKFPIQRNEFDNIMFVRHVFVPGYSGDVPRETPVAAVSKASTVVGFRVFFNTHHGNLGWE